MKILGTATKPQQPSWLELVALVFVALCATEVSYHLEFSGSVLETSICGAVVAQCLLR